MLVMRVRLPFVRVAVWSPSLLCRAARPAFVSGQGARRCQMETREVIWEGEKRLGRLWVESRVRRESWWCWSTVL
jgi:hypothetical protein